MALLVSSYFWPHMEHNIKMYAHYCLICQHNKIEMRNLTYTLQSLLILEGLWGSLSTNFITALSRIEGHEATKLFLMHIVKL